MIDLNKYRIIDLTMEMCPTIIKNDGRRIYPKPSPGMDWNETIRNFGQAYKHLFLRQVINDGDKHWMHYIECESHLGTHVEVGSHLRYVDEETGEDVTPKGLKTVTELPLETWLGEAAVFNFSDKRSINGKRQEITPDDLKRVKEGDIVLMYSKLSRDEAPLLTRESVNYLIGKKIKQIAGLAPFTGIVVSWSKEFSAHDAFMENNIVFLESLINMDKIKKERVFYMGIPWKVQGLDACHVHAIVLEERE